MKRSNWVLTFAVMAMWVVVCACRAADSAPAAMHRSALVIGPERSFGVPALGPEGAAQSGAAAAFGAQEYLVVWGDDRTGTNEVYGTRLTPLGMVLDPTGIAISAGALGAEPVVAFDGVNFWVVWKDLTAIRAARVSPTGQVEPAPWSIALSATGNVTLALAFGSSGGLLVWSQIPAGAPAEMVVAARLSLTGDLLDAVPFTVSQVSGLGSNPAVASDGADFLVLRTAPNATVVANRVSWSGGVLDGSGIVLGGGSKADLAWNGSVYLAVWYTTGGSADIQARRLTLAGTLLEAAPFVLAAQTEALSFPSVATQGTDFFVTWTRPLTTGRQIEGTRVSAAGVVLDTPSLLVVQASDGVQQTSGVASDGSDALVLWGAVFDQPDVMASRVSSTGLVRDPAPILLSTARGSQRTPAVAWQPGVGELAWVEFIGGHHAVIVQPLDSLGLVLDGGQRWVSSGPASISDPSVAMSPSGVLVAWSQNATKVNAAVFTLGLTPSGAPLQAMPSGLGAGSWPSVAFSGATAFVGWYSAWQPPMGLLARRVSLSSGVLDATPMTISSNNLIFSPPKLAALGSGALATWCDGAPGEMFASRLSADGQVLDQPGASLPLGTGSGFGAQAAPALAVGAGIVMVVWSERGELKAVRLQPDGQVLPPGTLLLGLDSSREHPDVAFDGARFIVAWDEPAATTGRQIGVAAVSTAGAVLAQSLVTEGYQPKLAATGVGGVAMAYLHFESSPDIQTSRLKLRLVSVDVADADPNALRFSMTPPTAAECHQTWSTPPAVLSNAGPFQFTLAVAPEAMSVAPDTGVLSWLPPRTAGGLHRVRLVATAADGTSAAQELLVDVHCEASLRVGCACSGEPAGLMPAVLAPWLWLLARRWRNGAARLRELKE